MNSVSNVPLFASGRLVATPGALALLEEAKRSPSEFLSRHLRGDWGELCQEDKTENELSLKHGFRLLSSYPVSKRGSRREWERIRHGFTWRRQSGSWISFQAKTKWKWYVGRGTVFLWYGCTRWPTRRLVVVEWWLYIRNGPFRRKTQERGKRRRCCVQAKWRAASQRSALTQCQQVIRLTRQVVPLM